MKQQQKQQQCSDFSFMLQINCTDVELLKCLLLCMCMQCSCKTDRILYYASESHKIINDLKSQCDFYIYFTIIFVVRRRKTKDLMPFDIEKNLMFVCERYAICQKAK